MNVYRRSGRWRGPWRFCVGGLLVVLCSAPCRTSQAIATAQPRNVSVGGWRYTTSAPSRDWMQIDYRDAMWPLGEPGFGNQGLPPFQQSLVKTAWVTPDIWIRGTFEVQDITSPLGLRLTRGLVASMPLVLVDGKLSELRHHSATKEGPRLAVFSIPAESLVGTRTHQIKVVSKDPNPITLQRLEISLTPIAPGR